MRRLALVVALLGITTVAAAATAPRDRAQEQAIDEAVSAVDPASVAVLHQGNDAMDQGDPATAAQKYGAVHAKAPNVASVTRRLCTAEWRSGNVDGALEHCREALKKEDSPENHAALAVTLLQSVPPTQRQLEEAMREARAAADRAPNTEYAQTTLCEVAVQMGDIPTLEECSTKLRTMSPMTPSTHLFVALALAGRAEIDSAQAELDTAHKLGLDEKTYQTMHERIELLRPKRNVWLQIAEGTLIGWIGIVFVMGVLGMLFSDAASRGMSSRALRSAYRAWIVVTTSLFYVSGLIGAVLFLGFVGLLVFAFLWLSEASRVVQAVVGVVSAYVVFATMRAMLGRVPPRDLGTKLDLDEEPELRAMLDGVAKRLRMRKLDAVYAEPDATIEIIELGGAFGHLRGKNGRALVLGIAALEGLTIRELEALVASELARFREKDGAGGDVAIVERAALDDLSERMEIRGVATAANPAWWFVRAFRAIFERLTEGAVGLQDELADARAAKAYGSVSLTSGLRHLARRAVEIESRATASLHKVLEGASELDDVYGGSPSGPDSVAEAIEEALEELADREKRITALDEDGYRDANERDAKPAWSLFSDREALEREMTDRLRAALRDHVGFEIEADQDSKDSSVARA